MAVTSACWGNGAGGVGKSSGCGRRQLRPTPALTNERCAARGKAVPLRRQVPRRRNRLLQRPSDPLGVGGRRLTWSHGRRQCCNPGLPGCTDNSVVIQREPQNSRARRRATYGSLQRGGLGEVRQRPPEGRMRASPGNANCGGLLVAGCFERPWFLNLTAFFSRSFYFTPSAFASCCYCQD